MNKKQTKAHWEKVNREAKIGMVLLLAAIAVVVVLCMHMGRKDQIVCLNTSTMGVLCDFKKNPMVGKCYNGFYKILTVHPSQENPERYVEAVTENAYGTIDYKDLIFKSATLDDCDIYDLKKEIISLRKEMYELTKGK